MTRPKLAAILLALSTVFAPAPSFAASRQSQQSLPVPDRRALAAKVRAEFLHAWGG